MNVCPRCSSPADGGRCQGCGYAPALIDGFAAYAPELARQAAGYEPGHFEVFAGLEANNFWFRARNALILYALDRFFPEARRFLEVGCGTGFVLSAIASARPALEVHGSEIFVRGLSFAAQRVSAAKLFQMDARSMPFSSTFDVIGAFDVIEHIDDDARVLAELRKALTPGGGLIMTVPQHPWLWSVKDEWAHHARRYEAGELERKLVASGFAVRWTSSFVSLLLPALVLSRKGRRQTAEVPDPYAEFRIPGWLNGLFYRVMRVEHALIRAGLRFPIGGSRIVVAFKSS